MSLLGRRHIASAEESKMEHKIKLISQHMEAMGFVKMEMTNDKRVAYRTKVGEGYGATNIFVFADQSGISRVVASITVPPVTDAIRSSLLQLFNRLNDAEENILGTFLISTDESTRDALMYRTTFVNSVDTFDFEAFKYVLQASFEAIQFALPQIRNVFERAEKQ